MRWCPWLIIVLGAALRVWLTCVWPATQSYDNHIKPVQIILEEQRLPHAADCWECYQPPLYYLLAAGVYAAASAAAIALRETNSTAIAIGLKAIQFLSTVAGILTLVVIGRVLRRAAPGAYGRQTLALGVVALLPRHLYMSAMVTNDALTYLFAALAVFGALRAEARGWRTRDCLLTGVCAGAAVLTKAYGWVIVVAIVAALWWMTRRPRSADRRGAWLAQEFRAPTLCVFGAALAVGLAPGLRNIYLFERFHVDNYDFFDSPMRFQPPGSVADVEFLTFRPGALWAHPWLHTAHLDSFPTELYGRLWFDYEGFRATLGGYPQWEELWARCEAAYPIWNPQRWNMLLEYESEDVPEHFATLARLSYAAGFPLTLIFLGGWARCLWRGRRAFVPLLLSLVALGGLAVPLVQVLRLPHFAAMKAAFVLVGLVAVGPLVAEGMFSSRRWIRQVLTAICTVALLMLAAADVAFVVMLGGPRG